MGVPARRCAISLVLIAGLLAACAPLPSKGPPGPNRESPALPDPHPIGGTVTIGLWQQPASYLSAGIVDRDTFANAIDAPVAEGLLGYRSASEITGARAAADYWRPLLATEVPTVENGDVRTHDCPEPGAAMCVAWKLRSGVSWHDGSTFTSRDVCDTFRLYYLRYRDNNPTALLSTAGWDQVMRCIEPDAHTAIVDFRSQYGPYLTLGSGVYGILPASILEPAFAVNADLQLYQADVDLSRGTGAPEAFRGKTSLDHMVDGTGPFVLANEHAADRVTLVRNHRYWDPDHRPHLDRMVFIFEADLASAVSAVKSGSIDMAFDLRLANLPGLLETASQGSLTVQALRESGAEKLDFNLCATNGGLCTSPTGTTSTVTADPIVRRAILTGINRQAIIDRATAGKSSIPPDSWMSLGAPHIADPALPTTRYDPVAANRILDEAGYALSPNCSGGKVRAAKDGTCLTMRLGTTNQDGVRLTTEALVATDLAAIGIQVLQPFSPNLAAALMFASFADGGPIYAHAFETVLYTTSLVAPGEPDRYLTTYHGNCRGACPSATQVPSTANNGAGQNATGESNPDLDRALDQGHNSVDPSTRTRAYRSAEHILARDLPEIPLYQQLTINAHRSSLHGVQENDLLWDFNSADWYCAAGKCQ